MAEAKLAPNEKKVVLVRLGTHYNDKGKPSHRFQYVINDTELGEQLSFEVGKYNKRIHGVGTVWEISEFDEVVDGKPLKKWGLGGAAYLRMWADKGQRLAWDAEQKVRDMENDAELKAKSAGEDSPLNDMLAKLRALYRSQVGANRSRFLAYVVKEIVK